MHDIKKTFSKGDSTNCSDKLHTITQIIHELILSYRINRIPERNNKHPLRSTNLTLDGNNHVMKKLIIIRKNRSSRKHLIEDKMYEKHGKQYMHCTQNTLQPYKNELTSNAFGYNVMKQKKKLQKSNKKILSIGYNVLNKKVGFVWIDVLKIFESNDFFESFEVS